MSPGIYRKIGVKTCLALLYYELKISKVKNRIEEKYDARANFHDVRHA